MIVRISLGEEIAACSPSCTVAEAILWLKATAPGIKAGFLQTSGTPEEQKEFRRWFENHWQEIPNMTGVIKQETVGVLVDRDGILRDFTPETSPMCEAVYRAICDRYQETGVRPSIVLLDHPMFMGLEWEMTIAHAFGLRTAASEVPMFCGCEIYICVNLKKGKMVVR